MDLEEYDPKTHPWYKKIKKLDLGSSYTEKLPEYLKQMHWLVKLDLSLNMITEIKAGTFKNLPKLRELNLSRNEITTLPRELDLGRNKTKLIDPESFFSKLPKLYKFSF